MPERAVSARAALAAWVRREPEVWQAQAWLVAWAHRDPESWLAQALSAAWVRRDLEGWLGPRRRPGSLPQGDRRPSWQVGRLRLPAPLQEWLLQGLRQEQEV